MMQAPRLQLRFIHHYTEFLRVRKMKKPDLLPSCFISPFLLQ